MICSRPTVAVTALLLLLTGCDPAVDSFQENDLHYSLFGILNATADSQFVRVEPLRDGMLTRAPETLDAEVTLTNLSTNRTVTLRDSLFRYLDQATAHNFYTTIPIDSGTTYRLQVKGPNGAKSYAETAVPSSGPGLSVLTPVDRIGEVHCGDLYHGGPTTVVVIRGVERIVSVRALYFQNVVSSVGHLADTVHTASGTVKVRIPYYKDLCKISGEGRLRRIEVMVAAGTPEWPAFLRLDQETELLPDVASNVEGGVGFVGGIVTDTVTVYPYFDD